MFGTRVEDDFANDLAATSAGIERSGVRWLLWLVLLGIGAFFYWASTYKIEESARATGRVIPSQQVQTVQSLEGGIVSSIAIAEGDFVLAGQPLMQIDDTRFDSQRGELLKREAALLAEGARLEAEARFSDEIRFPDGLSARTPLATQAEAEVFLSRREQLTRELEVLDDQLRQRRSELAEMMALRQRTRDIIAPLQEEVVLTEDIVTRNLVPRIELLRLKSRLAELLGDISVSIASEARLLASIQEAENQIDAARSSYVLSARQRLAQLQLELAVIQESLRAAEDRVRRTQLRAPVEGIVNNIAVKTIGAVVQPGQPLVDIVPMDDSLLIEANLGPRDIGFVRTGETASVKISAYDYLQYGALEGEVVRIGADTIQGPDGQEFFRVIVRTGKSYLGSSENPLPITPGMVAQVDIQTGERTVLDYLTKPILRAQSEALRER